MGIAAVYIAGTLNFLGDISKNMQVQDYYVVVKKDSSFESIKDIKGRTVGVMILENEHYKNAQDKLKENVTVDLKEDGSYLNVAKNIIEEKHDVIF